MKKVFLFSLVFLAAVAISPLTQAATIWYLPEGSTQTNQDTGDQFILWILVTNPNDSDANIKLTFYKGSGDTETTTATVSANSRWTYRVNDLIENEAISTKIECTNGLNIYAERAMYWGAGGHTSRGIAMSEAPYNEISQPSSFPITISQSGSYKLTGNITCSDSDTNAITISASNVTLDLNGFTIAGPGYNSGSSGNGINVSDDTLYSITITNGNIRNFREKGISIHASSGAIENVTLNNLTLDTNGEWGIYLYSIVPAIVQDCLFYKNGAGGASGSAVGGLRIYKGTIVRNNSFYYNTGYGIYVSSSGDGNIIERNTVSSTQDQAGITTDSGIYVYGNENRIEANVCIDNTTSDIHFDGTDNLCIDNAYKNIDAGTGNFTTVSDQGNTDLDA